ncbi:MAG: sigma-70 factor domain-containing protein, partial [Planctomycetota bacterium]
MVRLTTNTAPDRFVASFDSVEKPSGDSPASATVLDDDLSIYLDQMAQTPLLSQAEELRLAKQMQDSRGRLRFHLTQVGWVADACVNDLADVLTGIKRPDRILDFNAQGGDSRERLMA